MWFYWRGLIYCCWYPQAVNKFSKRLAHNRAPISSSIIKWPLITVPRWLTWLVHVRFHCYGPDQKGTAHALFRVVMHHRDCHTCEGCGTHNRGMTLITGVVTLVTGMVMLVTHSYMRKNGGEVPGQDAVGVSWRQGGWDEWPVVIYLVVFPSRGGEAPGQDTVGAS